MRYIREQKDKHMNTEKEDLRGRPRIADCVRNRAIAMREKGFSFNLIAGLLCISRGSAYTITGHIKTSEKRGVKRGGAQYEAQKEAMAQRASQRQQARDARLEAIIKMRSEGETIYSIAKVVGVSAQRISQIIKAQKP